MGKQLTVKVYFTDSKTGERYAWDNLSAKEKEAALLKFYQREIQKRVQRQGVTVVKIVEGGEGSQAEGYGGNNELRERKGKKERKEKEAKKEENGRGIAGGTEDKGKGDRDIESRQKDTERYQEEKARNMREQKV